MILTFKIAITAVLIMVPTLFWLWLVAEPWNDDGVLPALILTLLGIVAVVTAIVGVWQS